MIYSINRFEKSLVTPWHDGEFVSHGQTTLTFSPEYVKIQFCNFNPLCVWHKQVWTLPFISSALWCWEVHVGSLRTCIITSHFSLHLQVPGGLWHNSAGWNVFYWSQREKNSEWFPLFCLIIHCHDRHIEQSKQTQRGNTISLSTSNRRGCRIKACVECVCCVNM